MLNPDGVYRGHYRTDVKGVNLNRMYLDPDPKLHPSVYGTRCLVLHYHMKGSLSASSEQCSVLSKEACKSTECTTIIPLERKPRASSENASSCNLQQDCGLNCVRKCHSDPSIIDELNQQSESCCLFPQNAKALEHTIPTDCHQADAVAITQQSGIALYVDLHAHATKRGCFIYGNYFKNEAEQVENMLFPKVMSLNSPHLDFDHCVFSEKNMYTADRKDGLSKEGSGRVALYKATGIIHRYVVSVYFGKLYRSQRS